jgi:hypothetical protein
MLQSISWWTFVRFLFAVTAIYYAVVFVKFYRYEIKAFLRSRRGHAN